jgi:hypothetical protein
MEDFDIVFFKDLALGGKPMSFVELLFFFLCVHANLILHFHICSRR